MPERISYGKLRKMVVNLPIAISFIAAGAGFLDLNFNTMPEKDRLEQKLDQKYPLYSAEEISNAKTVIRNFWQTSKPSVFNASAAYPEGYKKAEEILLSDLSAKEEKRKVWNKEYAQERPFIDILLMMAGVTTGVTLINEKNRKKIRKKEEMKSKFISQKEIEIFIKEAERIANSSNRK